MTDLRYWVGFNIVQGIGPAKTRALLDHFGDLEAAWHASADALRAAGLDRRALANLLETRRTLDLEAEMARLERAGLRLITWESPDYPPLLAEIPDPPPLLYVKGELRPEDRWALAVVGTRRATAYGRQVTETLVGELARNRITIVSGLARGIDRHAHQAALAAGGRTIAVLGHGLDQVYPPEHRRLAAQIVEAGALISEYPLGTRPEAGNFPPRNRIISGLSLGVLVVEAGLRSGALITADYAAEQGRDVFAVPGNITARSSRGTNRLIQDGAKMVLEARDILEELNMTMVAQHVEVQMALPENETEARLLSHLSMEPLHVDEIARDLALPIAEVSSTLALMELKGMVRQVGGMHYVLARESGIPYMVD
ncbi:MAG TPA: DNA-protecting protein DprA [Chloroflexi bacterium]|nr:DNA-protecting protein DprA [Chloroflexota bacterium]